jgi:dCTP deaminase
MILTGQKIQEEVLNGTITIEPFYDHQINPNSYNYKLGSTIKVYRDFVNDKSNFSEIFLPEEGYILTPGVTYLANTHEVIGSDKYAMSLIGRSSMGRYGLFLQVSANLGHTTSKHKWTLEIVAALPIKIYPGMVIGQVSFWTNYGDVTRYNGRYGAVNHPQESFA